MDQQKNWVFNNARVIDPSRQIDRIARLVVRDGHFDELDVSDGELPESATHIDATDCVLAPGLVDLETEIGEPGLEEDECVATCTLAAVSGGYTSLACAANTDPPVDTAPTVEFIRQKAAQADNCRVYPIGCVSKNRDGQELAEIGSLVDAGAIALSDSPRPLHNTALLRRALEYCSMFNRPLIDRPEVPSLTRNGLMHEGLTQLKLAMSPMPSEAEDLATSRDLRMLEATGGRLHLSSISTQGSVELVKRTKQRGIAFTVGIRVGNLAFSDELVTTFDSSLIVNPPLRSQRHLDACLEAIKDGTIDVIASGHQPKALEKKMQELSAVPFGMTSLDTTLSKMFTDFVANEKLSWSDLIRCMATNPAQVLGLEAGTLAAGKPADLLMFDPRIHWKVESSTIESRSKNTPLLGSQLKGRVTRVLVGGKLKRQL